MQNVELPTGPALRAASIEELFRLTGALLDGHFALKSGRHTTTYLEKFLVLQHPSLAVEIGRRLAAALGRHDPDVVVGPTTGGVLLAHEVARQLEGPLLRPMRSLFAEPAAGGGRALRRGFRIAASDRVVLVDDVLTTGASLVETAAAVRAAGGEPLGAAVIVQRNPQAAAEMGIPVDALGTIEIASHAGDACPACAAGTPLTRPGSFYT